MQILSPDKNLTLLKYYHKSNKLILPLLLLSLGSHTYELNITKYLDTINILNLGYHSYVSSSCIINDYIKPKNIKYIFRVTNFKSHIFANIGLINYVYNNYKN